MVGDGVTSDQSMLASSDVRLRAFVDAVFDAYYDWHFLTGRMEMSAQMDELLRLRPGQLPRTVDGWLERIHPDDRERVLENNQRAARRGGVYEGDYRMRRGDRSYILVRDRGVTLRDDQGRPAHMVGAIRDITREQETERVQREAAELYHALFAQAVNPAYHIAEQGLFLDANAAGLKLMGTSKAKLLGENVENLWGKDAAASVKAALKNGAPVGTLDLALQVGDTPKAMTVTLLGCVFRGQSTCFALGTDLTEHKTLQRALEASEESLRRQAAALEDVNTALRVILDQRNQDRAEFERAIAANVETIIAPLLERLRKQLGKTPEAIYADAALRNLRELVRPLAQSLDALTEPDVPLTPREREIANLVRTGKSSSEIAAALCVSPATVAFHRKNLRRKLHLEPHGPSLATHLMRMPP